MNFLDYILLGIVIVSVIPALIKGFVYESLMLIATVVGIVLATWKYHYAAQWFVPLVSAPALRSFLGFLAILVLVWLLAMVIAKLASRAVDAAGLRWFDRLLGAGLGLVRGVLICIVLLIILTAFPFALNAVRLSSLAPDFLTAGEALVEIMPGGLRRQFQAGLTELRNVPASAHPVASGAESNR